MFPTALPPITGNHHMLPPVKTENAEQHRKRVMEEPNDAYKGIPIATGKNQVKNQIHFFRSFDE